MFQENSSAPMERLIRFGDVDAIDFGGGRRPLHSGSSPSPRNVRTTRPMIARCMAMRIRGILLSIVCVLSLLLLGESGVEAYRAWEKQQAAGAFLELDRTAELLLKSTAGWAAERGATNAGLNSAAVVPPEQREAIAKRRPAPDESFRSGTAALRRLTASETVAQALAASEAALAKMTALRVQVDQSLALPLADRPAELVRGWVPAITDAIEKTNRLRLVAEIVAEPPEARLIRLTQLRHLVSEMAEYAGRERPPIAGTIAARKPIGGDAMRILSQNRRRVELAWRI